MSTASIASRSDHTVVVTDRTERLLWVAAIALLICLRLPGILIHGRFYGEEGNPIYQSAWTLPWYRTLLGAIGGYYGGYLSLPPNAAGLLARYLAPIEYAPYVTITVALLIQITPAILLATARDEWLAGRTRLLAALLLATTPPVSDEIWLATTHAQVHLALASALVLVLEIRGGAIGVFRLFVLCLAAFSGPAVWALIPFFVLRSYLDGSRGRAVQAAVLAACTIVQLLFFFHMRPDRVFAGPGMQLLIFFVRHLAIPFLGHDQAYAIAQPIYRLVDAQQTPVWPMVISAVAFTAFAVMVFWQRVVPARWMFVSAMTLAVLGYSGAIHGGKNMILVDVGHRYSFAPNVLFALSLFAIATLGRDRARQVASAIVVWLIVIGVHEYFVPTSIYYASGPDWRSQVAAWRADPSRPLETWPGNGTWLVHLPPSAR